MARTVRNAKIDTRSSRSKLDERREPYWTVVSAGCAIGYRKGRKGGTWIARLRGDDGKQHYDALGAADDARDHPVVSPDDLVGHGPVPAPQAGHELPEPLGLDLLRFAILQRRRQVAAVTNPHSFTLVGGDVTIK